MLLLPGGGLRHPLCQLVGCVINAEELIAYEW